MLFTLFQKFVPVPVAHLESKVEVRRFPRTFAYTSRFTILPKLKLAPE